MSKIIQGDSLEVLKTFEESSIDLVCTDPPYGYSFMGKDWDKAVPSVEIWQECLRVLKPGAFCFVMSAPRSDVQNAMISRLMEAGFRLDFTPIYWTYASGFPKAGNIGKLVDKRNGTTPDQSREFADYIKARRLELGITLSKADKEVCNGTTNYSWFEGRPTGQRLPKPDEYERIKQLLQLDTRYDEFIGEAEREIVGKSPYYSVGRTKDNMSAGGEGGTVQRKRDITQSATDQAKQLDGSYAGFQPKPAVEVIIVAMKPLSEKTYVDQALANGHGITWLDDARIPTEDSKPAWNYPTGPKGRTGKGTWNESNSGFKPIDTEYIAPSTGRFPANLLVSDDVLNDGVLTSGTDRPRNNNGHKNYGGGTYQSSTSKGFADSGSYSRYFDLDKWAQNLPFLIVPKASKGEKNRGLETIPEKPGTTRMNASVARYENGIATNTRAEQSTNKNHHPTVKPLRLMSYLIQLGSRETNVVLDPFVGSGTTVVAADNLKRIGIGIERDSEYVKIAKARLKAEAVNKQTELL